MGLELFCCHSIRLNHDINKLVEIIYVGITKQIMPRPLGDMASPWVVNHPSGWSFCNVTLGSGHYLYSESALHQRAFVLLCGAFHPDKINMFKLF